MLNGTDNMQLSSPSRRYNHEGKTAKVLTVSSRGLREHGGNGATPALESPREEEKCLRWSIVCKFVEDGAVDMTVLNETARVRSHESR